MNHISGYYFDEERLIFLWLSASGDGCSQVFDKHEDVCKIVDRILSGELEAEF